MEGNLVTIIGTEVYTTTLNVAKGFKVDHRAVIRLLNRYKSEFEEFGVITTALQKPTSPKGGRPTESFYLNEEQAMYMGTLFTNNDRVRKFKMLLTKEFFRQRKLLMRLVVQKQNAEWLQKRAGGKVERRLATDTIQKFVEYAKSQGSRNAEKYYMIISKMENHTLFNLDYLEMKFPNLREVVNGFALDSLKMADHVVGKALHEGMEQQVHYKEIYQMARSRVESFANIIGKTPIALVAIN